MTTATGPGWDLRLGDCVAGLQAFEAQSVDVSIFDAPYDEHVHAAGRRGSLTMTEPGKDRERSRRAGISRNRDLGFAALTPATMQAVARECGRVVRRWSLAFCSLEMISDWRAAFQSAGLQYVRTALWHKLGSTPQFTGDRPAVAAEAIVCAHPRGRKRWNGGGRHGWFAHAPVEVGSPPPGLLAQIDDPGARMIIADWYEERGVLVTDAEIRARHAVHEYPIVLERGTGEVRLHTTQKPLALMRELVRLFSDPGELVGDWFTGSATTGLAALMERRRFVGWELDARYHAIAARRLAGGEAKPIAEQPSLLEWGAR